MYIYIYIYTYGPPSGAPPRRPAWGSRRAGRRSWPPSARPAALFYLHKCQKEKQNKKKNTSIKIRNNNWRSESKLSPWLEGGGPAASAHAPDFLARGRGCARGGVVVIP